MFLFTPSPPPAYNIIFSQTGSKQFGELIYHRVIHLMQAGDLGHTQALLNSDIGDVEDRAIGDEEDGAMTIE